MNKTNELIDRYLDEILSINETINLTRITEKNQAKLLHIEDSLAALPFFDNLPEGLYGDLGSGGGFPGVPLAIMTGRETILIDSVKKKMSTVQTILDKLDLKSISTYDGRIEDLVKTHRNSFVILTARALSSLPSLLELASPLLQNNGLLICYKGQLTEEELNNALSLENLLGMKFLERKNFLLSDNETNRSLILFKKISKPRISLPRRVGLAQKKPLVS